LQWRRQDLLRGGAKLALTANFRAGCMTNTSVTDGKELRVVDS